MPEICLLGTGGMMPLKNRWLTSCYIEFEGSAILIDCGEGTQIALCEHGCKISRIDALLITHMHADHISGLPGFLLSLGNSSREEPLDIYIPQGKAEIIKNLMCICERLPFEIRLHEIPLDKPHTFSLENIAPMLKATSLPLRHSCDCLGYSFTQIRKQVFLPEKAKALNVPLPMWKILHSGEDVTLDDGRIITSEMVTQNSRRPIKITYVTDSLPFRAIADFAKNSQLFICEGMYGEEDKKDSMNQKGHMLMSDACKLAKAANAEKLWLTHYSPAEAAPQRFEKSLKKIFENVTISRDGERIIIKD